MLARNGLFVSLCSFLKQERGMTLPLVAVSFMVITGFVGVSVDFARAQLVQSKLSFALDAAGLAAGTTMNTSNISTEVAKYLKANFPTGYLGSTEPSTTIAISEDNLVIDLSASTSIEPIFMTLFGFEELKITAQSQITRTSSGLELVMVLDNTGSMNDDSKLSTLKSAANDLVDILYGDKDSIDKLWIGLVPFSQAVNIGTSRTSWLDATSTYNTGLDWTPTSWYGCVDERLSGMDSTDDPPSVAGFLKYYYPSGANKYVSNFWKSSLYQYSWTHIGSYYYYPTLNPSTRGPNYYCPQAMTAMTANKTIILNAVNSMTAVGGTHVNVGLVWGWRMLSPRWRGWWGGEMDSNDLPLDYHTKHMNKAVVLLTDGENTMYVDDSDRTAYGYLSEGRLGVTNVPDAVAQLNTRLTTVCTSLKSQGVYVYTIALGNPGTTIQNLLKGCATAENYYFNSPTAADLRKVFSAIADSLSNLRVSM